MTKYRRIIPAFTTPEQQAVWDAGENSLVYHMTETERAISADEVTADANKYVADYPEDFDAGFTFTVEYVAKALEALADAGFEERET